MDLLEKKLTKKQYDGLYLTIEVKKGEYRTGKDSSGKEWKSKMYCDYGYILKTNSPDGEHLDCFVKSPPRARAPVFVCHLLKRGNLGKYDEDKVFLGFGSLSEVKTMFGKSYPMNMWGGCTEFDMEHFKVIAFSASSSKTMITDQATYDKFKKDGKLSPGIKSPIQTAMAVSENRYYIRTKDDKEKAFKSTFSTLNEAKMFYSNLVAADPFEIAREGCELPSRILHEGLRKDDLRNIVMPVISFDEYVAKEGTNNIVLAFFIKNEPAAVEPLKTFCEALPGVELVDAGDSASMKDTSVLYVEFKREKASREVIEHLIDDVMIVSGLCMDDVSIRIPNSDKLFRLGPKFLDIYFAKAV